MCFTKDDAGTLSHLSLHAYDDSNQTFLISINNSKIIVADSLLVFFPILFTFSIAEIYWVSLCADFLVDALDYSISKL